MTAGVQNDWSLYFIMDPCSTPSQQEGVSIEPYATIKHSPLFLFSTSTRAPPFYAFRIEFFVCFFVTLTSHGLKPLGHWRSTITHLYPPKFEVYSVHIRSFPNTRLKRIPLHNHHRLGKIIIECGTWSADSLELDLQVMSVIRGTLVVSRICLSTFPLVCGKYKRLHLYIGTYRYDRYATRLGQRLLSRQR